jgi:hypothetical protein
LHRERVAGFPQFCRRCKLKACRTCAGKTAPAALKKINRPGQFTGE